MNAWKRVLSYLLVIIILMSLCNLQVFAENGRYNTTEQTAYLRLTVNKYGKTYCTSSQKSGSPMLDVLENTKWNVKAEFVVVEEGRVVSQGDVTRYSIWNSSDAGGKTISVSNGTVSAGKYNGKSYSVSAAYEGTTLKKYYVNGALVKTERIKKTYRAALGFRVKQIKMTGDNTELMRAVALAGFAEEEWAWVGDNVGKTVSEAVYTKWNIDSNGSSGPEISNGRSKESPYLNYRSIADNNSGTFCHAVSAIAGSASIRAVPDPGTHMKAAVYSCDGKTYICLLYTGNQSDLFGFSDAEGKTSSGIKYTDIFEDAMTLCKSCAGSRLKEAVVIGKGVAGIAASYVSYLSGCQSVTIEAPSAVYVAMKNRFEEFCKNFDTSRQIFLSCGDWFTFGNTITQIGTQIEVSKTLGTTSSYAKLLQYNKNAETVRLTVIRDSEEFQAHSTVNDVYYGTSQEDGYDFPRTASPAYVFGANKADRIYVAGTQDYIKLLKKANLVNTVYSLYKTCCEKGIEEASSIVMANTVVNKDIQAVGQLFGESPPFWAECLLSLCENVDISTKTRLDWIGIILDCLDKKYNKYLVGGKGEDVIAGSSYDDNYIYCKGDGQDYIYDLGGEDAIYLMGYDGGINLELKEETTGSGEERYTQVWADNKLIIRVSSGMTGNVVIYQGSPFGSRHEIGVIYRNGLQKVKGTVLRGFRVSCPVDVQVYDPEGSLVYTLADGSESYAEEQFGCFSVEKEGSEYVKGILLYEEGYSIRIVGQDDGTMDYECYSINLEDGSMEGADVSAVPVHADEVFVPTGETDGTLLHKDQDGDGKPDGSVEKTVGPSFKEEEYTVEYGKTLALGEELLPDNSDAQGTWYSWSDNIVTVDSDGIVTAVGCGTGFINYTLENGNSAACAVKVTDQSISADKFTVTGLEESYAYTGEKITPDIRVKYLAVPLMEDRDYKIDFSSNTEPGQAKILIRGLGKYTGQKEISFTIDPPYEITSVDEKVRSIVQECQEQEFETEYEIALFLHDWLTENASYDFTYTYYQPDGVLIRKTGVCESYAEAYALLLHEFSIENELVQSDEMDHAWNIAKIDGKWCHVDCTWDDPGTGGAENHTYFGMSDNLIARDHVWDRNRYTACPVLDNYYYLREGYHVVYNDDEFLALLEEQCQAAESSIQCCYVGTDADYSMEDSWNQWYYRTNWKYGIQEFEISGGDWLVTIKPKYGEPWEQPGVFTGIAPCPHFILRGPEGTYDLENYRDNGMILIFGREGCLNTLGLADRLHSRLSELRDAGVEVVLNIENSAEPSDMDIFKEEYPNFVYTYDEPWLMYDMLDTLEIPLNQVIFPVVFFINKNARITFSSIGWVEDIDGFIEEAMKISTDTPLPAPGAPAVSSAGYEGSAFMYTGDRNLLSGMIAERIASRRESIPVVDATWEGDMEDWDSSPLFWAIYDAGAALREHDCDFKFQMRYWYAMFRGYPLLTMKVDYDVHEEVTDESVQPTCTENGLTEGTHCAICGSVLQEQEVLSPLGHNLTFHEEISPTCTENGQKSYFACEVCGKKYLDETGLEEAVGSLQIPPSHDYTDWSPNGDGTHTATCRHDASHTLTEQCSYEFTIIREQSEGTPEKGLYTCTKCGYSFEVENNAVSGFDSVEIDGDTLTYNGKEKKPTVTIPGLAQGRDYLVTYENNINAGTGTMTITGIGNYTGSVTRNFTIKPASIKSAEISLKDRTYTGKALTQTPVVKIGNTVLKANADYTVAYKNNTSAGTASVTISGKGNYTGTKTGTFKIIPAKQSVTVKASSGILGVGKTATLTVSGAKGEKTYSSSNKNVATVSSAGRITAKKAGTAVITVTAKATRNYKTGSGKITIKVTPAATASITAANQATGFKLTWKKVSGATGYLVYRGSTLIKTIKSGSTVTCTDKKANTNGTKYTFKIVPTSSYGNGASKSLVTYRVARPTISSATNSGAGKMTVKWSKNVKGTGYQLQYSQSKTFASGNKAVTVANASTVSKVIGSLKKGKTYYVRIRTYKAAGRAKYWSEWSAPKTLKIKK